MRNILIYLSVLLFSIIARGENNPPLSFQKCVEMAINQNIQIKIEDNNRQQASIDQSQSQWDMAPSFSGSANSNLNFRRSTNQFNEIESGTSYNVGYSINGSLVLFAGLTKVNTIAARKYLTLAFNEYTHQVIVNLYLQITDLYAQILNQKELIKVATERVEVSQQELERISALIESGLMESVSVHEINATLSGNKFELKKLKNQHDLLLLDLAHLIEFPEPENLDIVTDDFGLMVPTALNINATNAYSLACLNLPSVQAKEFELAYIKKVLSIAKGNMLPSLQLNGGYSSNFYSSDTIANGNQTPFSTQFSDYLNPSLGLSLSIPIFNGRYRSFNVRKQKLNVENVLYELENEKKILRREIEAVLKRLQNFEMEYYSAKDHLNYVEKSFETYRKKYELGLLNSTDFITAQNQLTEAKANVINAKYNWIVQEKTIKLYIGEEAITQKSLTSK